MFLSLHYLTKCLNLLSQKSRAFVSFDMVPLSTLKYLATERQKDAEVLLKNTRNSGAIYLMGYVIELSFKRKAGQVLGFKNGFPETVADFNSYFNQIARFTKNTGIE